VLFALALAGAAFLAGPRGVERTARIDETLKAVHEGKEFFLSVHVKRGDTYQGLAGRYTGSKKNWRRIRADSKQRTLRAGTRVRIAYTILKNEYKRKVVEALFPDDGYRDGAWVHRVRDVPYRESGETLWRIAEWFTGDGKNYRRIMEASDMRNDALAPGQTVRVPRELLLAAFVDGEAASSEEKPLVLGEGHPELGYGEDARGPFAVYRLKQGEALYSAVVVRFTGLLWADEVNQTALKIAKRSGIEDVTAIPVGFAVKIPLDLLLAEYLPAGHPRRAEYEEIRTSAARYRSRAVTENLEGVYVFLDAGHGGIDSGASHHGVCESEYVYDIMCRVHRLLGEKTKATSIPVVRNRERKYRPVDRERLPRSKATEVLTTPPFRYTNRSERAMFVNLRWYVANDHARALRKRGVSEDRLVFLSLHADALHTAVRGAMVYIPGARYVSSILKRRGQPYSKYREVRSHPYVRVSRRDKVKAQGYSNGFAQTLVRELRRRKLRVHPHNPVRDAIVRTRDRPYVPAVLRNNVVPTKILLETVNLANRKDAELMRKPSFREAMAEAIVEALRVHYAGGKGKRAA
jgi:N-acetylmuramoyl-L-alanine amidase